MSGYRWSLRLDSLYLHKIGCNLVEGELHFDERLDVISHQDFFDQFLDWFCIDVKHSFCTVDFYFLDLVEY